MHIAPLSENRMRLGILIARYGRILCVAVFMVSTVFSLSGCLDSSSVEKDIAEARASAYEKWEARKKQADSSGVFLRGALSLEDAIKLGLVNNKSLLAATKDKVAAKGRVLSSYSGVLPSVAMIGSYTRLDDNAYAYKRTTASLDQNSIDLQVTQPIFRGGATLAQMRSARLFACMSNHAVRQQVENTIYAVCKSYFDVLLAKHLYRVNREALDSARQHLDEVQKKRDRGVSTEYDVLRAKVDVSLYSAEAIQQKNRMHLSLTQLLNDMGVSQESDVQLTDALRFKPVKPVFEKAVEMAYRNRPDLIQSQIGLSMQQEAIRLAKSRFWPQVSGVFTKSWASPDPQAPLVDEWGEDHSYGISVSWPLFDGLDREGRLMQERAAYEKAQLQLLDAEEKAVLQVRQAIFTLRDSEEFVDSQKMNLEHAKEGLRLARVGYREGANTEVDVTDARSSLTRARGLYYEAIHGHLVARLNMLRYTGLLSPVDAGADAGEKAIFGVGARIPDPDKEMKRIEAAEVHADIVE